VVIVSARADLETKLRGFGLGACDYVSKPFSFDELLARIRAQLRRGHWGGDGTVVSAGALTLDLARRQARLGEVVADLSDREFRLLHHLARHQGEVVSRERLLSEVWGYHFDPRSNVVDVCVRRLRKKLGPEAPIETVRHGGYRLAPS
jgi:DNA-binding response OmpR family regulator